MAIPSKEKRHGVRPRDAASLILYRREGRGSILLGRRPEKAAFAPGVYVFPGGRLARSDFACAPSRPLSRATAETLSAHGAARGRRASAFANAAIRETAEETGLAVGGAAPDHAALSFLGRAITPPDAPIRFHARFFMAPEGAATGAIRSNGELTEIGYYPLDEALRLPIFDVTEFMLTVVRGALAAGRIEAPVLWSYRRGQPLPRKPMPAALVQALA